MLCAHSMNLWAMRCSISIQKETSNGWKRWMRLPRLPKKMVSNYQRKTYHSSRGRRPMRSTSHYISLEDETYSVTTQYVHSVPIGWLPTTTQKPFIPYSMNSITNLSKYSVQISQVEHLKEGLLYSLHPNLAPSS